MWRVLDRDRAFSRHSFFGVAGALVGFEAVDFGGSEADYSSTRLARPQHYRAGEVIPAVGEA